MIFTETHKRGRGLLLSQQNADFRNDNFNGKVKSIVIMGACSWSFYLHVNFQGNSFILDPNAYDFRSGVMISSARALPPRDKSALALFEGLDYTGRMLVLYQTERESIYNHHDFNDKAHSAVITGSPSWTLYFHGKFKGKSVTLQRGNHPSLPDSVRGQVSSVVMNGDEVMEQEEEQYY